MSGMNFYVTVVVMFMFFPLSVAKLISNRPLTIIGYCNLVKISGDSPRLTIPGSNTS